jgi:hypothetical protein
MSRLPKNTNMVSGQLLELRMRYCMQTWCIESLYEDPGCIAVAPLRVNVTVTKDRKMISGQQLEL